MTRVRGTINSFFSEENLVRTFHTEIKSKSYSFYVLSVKVRTIWTDGSFLSPVNTTNVWNNSLERSSIEVFSVHRNELHKRKDRGQRERDREKGCIKKTRRGVGKERDPQGCSNDVTSPLLR